MASFPDGGDSRRTRVPPTASGRGWVQAAYSAVVTVVGVLMVLGGVLLVIGGGGALLLGVWILSGSSDCDGEMCALGAFLGLALAAVAVVVGLIGGALCVYLGHGVVHRRPGRYWGAVFVSLGAASFTAVTAAGTGANTRAGLVTALLLAIPGVLLVLPGSLADLDAHKRDPVRRRR